MLLQAAEKYCMGITCTYIAHNIANLKLNLKNSGPRVFNFHYRVIHQYRLFIYSLIALLK